LQIVVLSVHKRYVTKEASFFVTIIYSSISVTPAQDLNIHS